MLKVLSLRRLFFIFGLTLLLIASRPAHADVTYKYTGGHFNVFRGDTGLTTANYVSVTLTLPAILPANQTDLIVYPSKWVFTDGVHTFKDNNMQGIGGFLFSTDSVGQITDWYCWNGVVPFIGTSNKSNLGIGDSYGSGIPQVEAFATIGSWSYSYSAPTPVAITTPSTNAHPDSNYIALTGTGPASSTIAIIVDGNNVTTTNLDANGNWETVVYLGPGSHSVMAQDISNPSNISSALMATPVINDYILYPARATTNYSVLRKADIFLTRGFGSPQISFYGIPTAGFQYTHTALYLGGDNDGTPMVAEAVTAEEGGAFGAVRDVPLEASTVWTDGTIVDIYRPHISLSDPQRSAVVTWAQGVTNQGLPYWGTNQWKYFGLAWLSWSPNNSNQSLAFNQWLKALDMQKYSTSTFICSTLVWHSYYSGTKGTVDLSLPNQCSPQALIGALVSPAFIQTIQPHFVFPDTLALDGQLVKVN